jgi:4-oxalocrotonate tautomerase
MFILRLTMLEGRTPEQKSELIRRLTDAAARHLDVPVEQIRMVIYEVPSTNWGVGGVSMAEKLGGNSDSNA